MTPLHLPSGRNHLRAEKRVSVLVLPAVCLILSLFPSYFEIQCLYEDLNLDLSRAKFKRGIVYLLF